MTDTQNTELAPKRITDVIVAAGQELSAPLQESANKALAIAKTLTLSPATRTADLARIDAFVVRCNQRRTEAEKLRQAIVQAPKRALADVDRNFAVVRTAFEQATQKAAEVTAPYLIAQQDLDLARADYETHLRRAAPAGVVDNVDDELVCEMNATAYSISVSAYQNAATAAQKALGLCDPWFEEQRAGWTTAAGAATAKMQTMREIGATWKNRARELADARKAEELAKAAQKAQEPAPSQPAEQLPPAPAPTPQPAPELALPVQAPAVHTTAARLDWQIEVTDLDALPDAYVIRTPDLKAIRAAVERGEKVPGVSARQVPVANARAR